MHVKRVLSIHVVVLAFLASLLLGLGQREPSLPLWTLLGAIGSIWFTDLLGWIRLNYRWANILILIIVFLSLGDLVRSRGADLAVSIARVLVFVQIVLLFRDKDRRCYWHLIVLSLLQVVVATSFEQDVLFGLLLLVFALVGVSSMAILFLHCESAYFERHAETPAHYGLRGSLDLRSQNWGRLFKIAVATFVIGPLSLFLQQKTESADEDGEVGPKPRRWLAGWRKTGKVTAGRWPLAHAEPVFSGTAAAGGWWGINLAFYRQVVGLTVKAVVIAMAVFFLTPRLRQFTIGALHFQHNGWGGTNQGGVRTVGFSDEIELGALGASLQNTESVLRIALRDEISGEEYRLVSGIYVQGGALTRYDAGRWSGDEGDSHGLLDFTADMEFVSGPNPAFRPPRQHTGGRAESLLRAMGSDRVVQEIVLEPTNTPLLFCVWPFYELHSEASLAREGDARLYRSPSRGRSRLALGTAAFVRGEQVPLVPCETLPSEPTLVSLPRERLPRLVALADEWVRESRIPATDPMGRARYLEQKLQTSSDFRYSLEGQPRDPSLDPVEDFVAINRAGHCEYFATALAMMLRSQGIPSRVVVGFRTEMYNSLGRFYQVRQLDAHAWVQAYIAPRYLDQSKPGWERGGWLRLDATPAAAPSVLGDLAGGIDSWREWLSYAWENYVVNMNEARQQQTFFEPLKAAMTELRAALDLDWWSRQWTWLVQSVRGALEAWKQGRWFDGRGGVLAALITVLLYMSYRGVRFTSRGLRAWRRRSTEGDGPRRGVRVEFYHRLELILRHFGLHRRPGQTPRELAAAFARQAAFPPADAELVKIPALVVDAFYRVRFGGKSLSRDEARAVEQALRELQRHEPSTRRSEESPTRACDESGGVSDA